MESRGRFKVKRRFLERINRNWGRRNTPSQQEDVGIKM